MPNVAVLVNNLYSANSTNLEFASEGSHFTTWFAIFPLVCNFSRELLNDWNFPNHFVPERFILQQPNP